MLRDDNRVWQCGDHAISLARPRIMGILNVTPDSFSDGGAHLDADAAIAYGLQLLDDGADIIDVGGESTRPGFTPVSPAEELARVAPVVEALAAAGAVVSIDTRHAEVARSCLELGASIVNDVTGFTDPEMVAVVRDSTCGVVVMHADVPSPETHRREVRLSSAPAPAPKPVASATVPAPDAEPEPTPAEGAETPSAEPAAADPFAAILPSGATAMTGSRAAAQAEADRLAATMAASSVRTVATRPVARAATRRRYALPDSSTVMRSVMGFLGDQARMLVRAGVSQKRICVDPGAGFGKSAGEDVVIQRATQKMASMGYPLMCAVSRKRFVGSVSGTPEARQRDKATIGVVLAALEGGANVLRVHDVAGTAQALDAYWACTHRDERRAFVAMGSNVDDPVEHLLEAKELIDEIPLTCVVNASHVYESEPALGLTDAVMNAMVELRTELSPLVLLDHLLAIEDQMGRTRPADGSKGPRVIDLDLVWYDGEEHAGPKLTLPHPGIGQRDFVIVPLDDLVPDGERFLRYAGIEVAERDERIGRVTTDLGELDE